MPKTSEKNGKTKVIFDTREERLINEFGRLAAFAERNAPKDSVLAILAGNLIAEHTAFVAEYNLQFVPDKLKPPAQKPDSNTGSGSGKGQTSSSE